MDPVSLIITALVAGAAAGGKDAATAVVTDAYNGLKALLLRRMAGDSSARTVIEEHEKDPDTWKAPVSKVISESEAFKDKEIVDAARRLLELSDPEGARDGRYNVTITASGERSVAAQNVTGNISTGDSHRMPVTTDHSDT
jgi:hypothetical protein